MDKKLLYLNIQTKLAITEEEFKQFSDLFVRQSIKKKQKLTEEGKANDRLYFIEKGLLFSFKTLDNGCEQVIQFAQENHWISDLYSFFSGSKALFTIQALEDTELLSITKQEFDIICTQHPKMETAFRLNFQSAYVNTLLRLSDVYSEDAESKYNHFVEHNPQLVQLVPQYLIASYLGILPSSLSRIRNKKSKK
ncbi:cAMP-binding domain of CRP or a regulatory subunit of cAMP-dependent protein kinases [Flexibacter flexilis DSM 6793]|uniref:cAMP-binding domain of CRP or a regulatory subunit of cAMP-dependent protein kinases n=1 Tax=Flexibacter flexilis DSM 6793 TaxID=927664 RepID=A0A1I1NNK1_9BACT|nr:Crp/Fnr family transcriptional regulator [Flexibacter flexilis]SFC99097.1 cAMP-binding domain of CRP or a regulatory subunit of cAMP-dependent protein kinases [Flexibacter flexilis DSM 6793]